MSTTTPPPHEPRSLDEIKAALSAKLEEDALRIFKEEQRAARIRNLHTELGFESPKAFLAYYNDMQARIRGEIMRNAAKKRLTPVTPTTEQIAQIHRLRRKRLRPGRIAKETGLPIQTVSRILRDQSQTRLAQYEERAEVLAVKLREAGGGLMTYKLIEDITDLKAGMIRPHIIQKLGEQPKRIFYSQGEAERRRRAVSEVLFAAGGTFAEPDRIAYILRRMGADENENEKVRQAVRAASVGAPAA